MPARLNNGDNRQSSQIKCINFIFKNVKYFQPHRNVWNAHLTLYTTIVIYVYRKPQFPMTLQKVQTKIVISGMYGSTLKIKKIT